VDLEGDRTGDGTEAAGTTEPAATPKRKRDMTIDELRAEYEALYGHATESSDRSYAEQTIMRSG
jgi:hypothetical protein